MQRYHTTIPLPCLKHESEGYFLPPSAHHTSCPSLTWNMRWRGFCEYFNTPPLLETRVRGCFIPLPAHHTPSPSLARNARRRGFCNYSNTPPLLKMQDGGVFVTIVTPTTCSSDKNRPKRRLFVSFFSPFLLLDTVWCLFFLTRPLFLWMNIIY